MANNSSQGVYSPLPQSLSDSDSEKDIPITVRPKFADRQNLHNGVHDTHHHNGYISPLQMMKIPEVQKVTPTMSTKRKICFLFSIAICFLTVFIFLWVIPCSENGTCPVKISNWENQHEGIELTGKINVVKSAFKNTLNLALLFKRNLNVPDSQSGVISVLGNNGVVAWYINQPKTSTTLNCYLIDVNGDDINDCLVLGEMGLEAVDPVSGTVFWHAHNHTQSAMMTQLDFPVILQDLNYDNINEILTTSNAYGESKFLIISGRTGILMGEINVGHPGIVNIIEINANNVIYSCTNDNETIYHQISVSDLISKIFNRTEVITSPNTDYVAKTHGYTLNGRRLLINNVGVCPDNCRVDIALVDEKSNLNIKAWSYQNSYSFIPASFSFKQTKSNLDSLKGHVNGFILKLWQWFGYSKKDKNRKYPMKRYVAGNNSSVQVNSIMERVVLITFNTSSFHVINASLTEITQLCLVHNFQQQCQPSLENQNNSLLITDLDKDGSQELVSYSSTFVQREDLKENWQLVSNMKVIRLEAELPKLYEVSK
ncbi:hypothetical protein RN001_014916 [Aquatica leii]|uniref:FAM234A/B beta-propeller domain-containing protein n=1 Tax=Aquatica leii TaxID=1421715 RepID=A0AAN7PPZ4_9COLE|nr:hypothetical protein RN001_014916 [Aquatica leii]